jgi:hypothetical protein
MSAIGSVGMGTKQIVGTGIGHGVFNGIYNIVSGRNSSKCQSRILKVTSKFEVVLPLNSKWQRGQNLSNGRDKDTVKNVGVV